jgi:hypothetical protein
MAARDLLQQFKGAKILEISGDAETVVLLIDTGDSYGPRQLAIYNAYNEPVAVRIDGMYVPAEEL